MKKHKDEFTSILILGSFEVFHKGYLDVLKKYKKRYPKYSFFIGVLDRDTLKAYVPLESDIRQLSAKIAVQLLQHFDSFTDVLEIGHENFKDAIRKIRPVKIIAFEHDETKLFLNDYAEFLKIQHIPVELTDHLLHWAAHNVASVESKKDHHDQGGDAKHKRYMKRAYEQTKNSGCFWRQVGCVLVKDDSIIFQNHNTMMPHGDECYKVGCVRDDIKPGEKTEICSAIHAEAYAVAYAAHQGVSLQGATLYVTVFPCPACAKLIAFSGIITLVYSEGWAHFDGERVLHSRHVSIIQMSR